MTSVSRGRVELRQSAANVLQGPVLIAVVLLAIVIRQLFAHPPDTIILGVCAGLATLDIALALYSLRSIGSTLVVTADDITFTRRHRRGKGPPPQQVIQRAAGSMLSFRMAANGPVGSDHAGYALKLRDNATGKKVYAARSAAARSSRPASRKDGRSPDRPELPCPGAVTRRATSG